MEVQVEYCIGKRVRILPDRRDGAFLSWPMLVIWQPVSFDHKFRADDDLAPILSYMWNNPEVPGQHFRCRKEEWLWFKSMVTLDVEYPEWLRKNPMG